MYELRYSDVRPLLTGEACAADVLVRVTYYHLLCAARLSELCRVSTMDQETVEAIYGYMLSHEGFNFSASAGVGRIVFTSGGEEAFFACTIDPKLRTVNGNADIMSSENVHDTTHTHDGGSSGNNNNDNNNNNNS